MVHGVKRRLELEQTLSADMEVAVLYDRSDLIGRAVGMMEKALLETTVVSL